MPHATESALLIPVPAAEPVVGRWRGALDPTSRLGVPAHVTLLYPFMPPLAIDDAVIARVLGCIDQQARFRFTLTGPRWFGQDVVYLAPEPAATFLHLTTRLQQEFPDYPPYRGRHGEVIPHLTIADHAGGVAMRQASSAVEAALPIAATAAEVWLMEGSDTPGSWHVRWRVELRPVSE